MEIINLIISLISGAVGGNVAGAAAKKESLGPIGNSITGLIGGGLGTYAAQALDLFKQVEGSGLDIGSLLGNIGTSGVSGAVLMLIVGFIKKAMEK
ncbi:MAG: hypothetical protein Q8M40_06490 [Legionella sp.]|nr:hypothetical protein [Legionella sp.]HRD68789.1 hypothetical protein [Legionella sp.]